MSLLFAFQRPYFSVRAIFRCCAMPEGTHLRWLRCTVQGCTPNVATCGFSWCEAHSITRLPNWFLFVCFTKGELSSSFFIIWPLITCPLEKCECGLRIVSEAPGPLDTSLRAQWRLSSCTSFQPCPRQLWWEYRCAPIFPTSPAPYGTVTQPSPLIPVILTDCLTFVFSARMGICHIPQLCDSLVQFHGVRLCCVSSLPLQVCATDYMLPVPRFSFLSSILFFHPSYCCK